MRIIVAGAGVIGCAVAYELARRGADVQVIDMRGAGLGATQASAGMLAPYIEGHNESLLQLGVCSLSAYDGFIERLTADAGRSIEYRRSGTIQVARTYERWHALCETADRLASIGVRHARLSPADLRELEPALAHDLLGGLLIPAHAYVAASALVAALVAAAQRCGARFQHAGVRSIACRQSALEVETSEGIVDADAVVVATGSWSTLLRQPSGIPVRPIRGQLVELKARAPLFRHVIWDERCYLVPWTTGTVLAGATVEDVGFEEAATAAGKLGLLDAARAVLPGLMAAAVTDVRVGLRPATPDELPIIGPSSSMPGVFFATGHFRNGILLAPVTAKLIADLMLERHEGSGIRLAHPSRFGL